ncbi:MAG: pyridoxal-phosphate dependent enzyme, partial [Pseudohongiellaceae bacterium]
MIEWPPRLALANLPTPVTRLSRYPDLPDGVEVWIKRDELTGTEVSGNKIRKLEFSLADAQAQGCATVITCGGLQSNHCRATAVLGARLGLRVHLLLRGEQPEHLDGNLLL